MDVVLDTVCVNHLTKRGPGREDQLTQLVIQRRVRVALDKRKTIADEWQRTSNPESVKALITKWSDVGGLVVVKRDGKLQTQLKKRLHELGFLDTMDKVVLQTALVTTDRIVVSEDSDFWDPRDGSRKGEESAPVAKLLREEEGVVVYTLGAMLTRHSVA